MTARNVLRHPPVRCNPLLADVQQASGLVNRAGLGVDRIYEELLLLGKDLPRYDADESHVRLVLPTRTHTRFVGFVHEVRRCGGALGVVSRIASWNPHGDSPVCSVDESPGMTKQSEKRREPSPFS